MTVKISAPCKCCGALTKGKYGYCQRSPECHRLYSREQGRQRDRSEYNRRWYAVNRERVLAHQKEYQAANREKLREYGARWRAANPDYDRKRLARPGRQCRVKGCTGAAVDKLLYCKPHDNESSRRRSQRRYARTARFLYDQQLGLCPDADHGGCGQPLDDPAACHIDHLIPAALDGPDEDWNLQLMHGWCNRVKQDRVVPAARALMDAR